MSKSSFRVVFRLFILTLGMEFQGTTVWAGYTHYFNWNATPDDDAVAACVIDMQKIIDARKSVVSGVDGIGDPIVEDARILFNGIGDNAHEPFEFPGDEGFNACKTQLKPYDDVVVACLCVARDHFSPEILEIESDGESDPFLFATGIRLFEEVFGRQPKPLFAAALIQGRSYLDWIFYTIALGFIIWTVQLWRGR